MLGLGYGVIQPILYDKTSYFAPNDAKSTEYFALLLTSTYIALSTIPFIVEFFGTFIKGNTDPSFPFILNGVIMTMLSIVVIVKHKNFVVQAGVIPQEAGVLKQPSSILAPGDRYLESSIKGSRQSATAGAVAAMEEGLAPVGVPMDVVQNVTAQAQKPIQVVAEAASPSQSIISAPVPPSSFSPDSVPHTGASKAADIMKKAELSLSDAQASMTGMRHQQAAMLREEAKVLDEKAEELHQEAQELREEADSLDASGNPEPTQ